MIDYFMPLLDNAWTTVTQIADGVPWSAGLVLIGVICWAFLVS